MDKEQFKKELIALMQRFFQEEQGNRVTSNNVEGFTGKLISLIDVHKPMEKPAEKK